MQINVALEENNDKQAEIIRSVWYPNTTASQTRDSFVFNDCIDRFTGNPKSLLEIIERDDGKPIVQRMLTIKADSNKRLQTIAAGIGKSLAATYRAIITYTIENLVNVDAELTEVKTEIGVSQLIKEKVALLEKQLVACNQTMEDIKNLIEEK